MFIALDLYSLGSSTSLWWEISFVILVWALGVLFFMWEGLLLCLVISRVFQMSKLGDREIGRQTDRVYLYLKMNYIILGRVPHTF